LESPGDLRAAEEKPRGGGEPGDESVRPRGEPPQPRGGDRLRARAGHDSAALHGGGAFRMIVDCHGHYTTAPQALWDWRKDQVGNKKPDPKGPKISDDELRETIEKNQLKLQRERGYDVISAQWSRVTNDVIHRVCALYPENFAAVCQLPQSPGVSPKNCIDELE